MACAPPYSPCSSVMVASRCMQKQPTTSPRENSYRRPLSPLHSMSSWLASVETHGSTHVRLVSGSFHFDGAELYEIQRVPSGQLERQIPSSAQSSSLVLSTSSGDSSEPSFHAWYTVGSTPSHVSTVGILPEIATYDVLMYAIVVPHSSSRASATTEVRLLRTKISLLDVSMFSHMMLPGRSALLTLILLALTSAIDPSPNFMTGLFEPFLESAGLSTSDTVPAGAPPSTSPPAPSPLSDESLSATRLSPSRNCGLLLVPSRLDE
mmetsp:Transcript_76370/g.218649  ORF Transcript_76370/g.218649 Transcript_76370/m.218649 type:complete len:265 (-) Transcript_76370:4143-4937(-)